jgi:hypothetical protein
MFRWLSRLLFDREPRVGAAVPTTPDDAGQRSASTSWGDGTSHHGGASVDGAGGACDGASNGGPGGDGGSAGGGGSGGGGDGGSGSGSGGGDGGGGGGSC